MRKVRYELFTEMKDKRLETGIFWTPVFCCHGILAARLQVSNELALMDFTVYEFADREGTRQERLPTNNVGQVLAIPDRYIAVCWNKHERNEFPNPVLITIEE